MDNTSKIFIFTNVVTDSCRKDEMYEIAQQAKYIFFRVSEMYKICDGLNVQNRLISCRV